MRKFVVEHNHIFVFRIIPHYWNVTSWGHLLWRKRPPALHKINIMANKSHKYREHMSMVSCYKGPTRHAYAWQIGPFWQDTLDVSCHMIRRSLQIYVYSSGTCGFFCNLNLNIEPIFISITKNIESHTAHTTVHYQLLSCCVTLSSQIRPHYKYNISTGLLFVTLDKCKSAKNFKVK